VPFNGNLHDIVLPQKRSSDRWFSTEAGFRARDNRRTSPTTSTLSSQFTGIRGDLINNLDASLFKNFRATGRYTMQFRFDYNALDHVQFMIEYQPVQYHLAITSEGTRTAPAHIRALKLIF